MTGNILPCTNIEIQALFLDFGMEAHQSEYETSEAKVSAATLILAPSSTTLACVRNLKTLGLGIGLC